MTKAKLYFIGVEASIEFLDFNGMAHPIFMTYASALEGPKRRGMYTDNDAPKAVRFLRRVAAGPVLGTGTGLYSDGHVFVNVPHTAMPVQNPAYRSWSWPGWKTDRTAIGVVAHEVGHYVEHKLQLEAHGPAWCAIIAKYKKQVSGYEPVPSEAWAESMRLFILNPDLLRKALPQRYEFICSIGLKALPRLLKKGYAKVLNNPAYLPAAERFVA